MHPQKLKSDPQQGKTAAACRLYVIPARDGRSAVIFRRGPSRQVLVLRWWLDDDRIEVGQWFNGRIYDRLSDLSPDGELLIYSAGGGRREPSAWVAISRPPYLTSLVLWKMAGMAYGSGVFEGPRTVRLDDTVEDPPYSSDVKTLTPMPTEDLQRHLEIVRRPYDPEKREHIDTRRLLRDGWFCIQESAKPFHRTDDVRFSYAIPGIDERQQPRMRPDDRSLVLRRILRGFGAYHGPLEVEDYQVSKANGMPCRHFRNCSWADWHLNGDLLFSIDGRLYRILKRHVGIVAVDPLENASLIADFTGMTFRRKPPPDYARCWP